MNIKQLEFRLNELIESVGDEPKLEKFLKRLIQKHEVLPFNKYLIAKDKALEMVIDKQIPLVSRFIPLKHNIRESIADCSRLTWEQLKEFHGILTTLIDLTLRRRTIQNASYELAKLAAKNTGFAKLYSREIADTVAANEDGEDEYLLILRGLQRQGEHVSSLLRQRQREQ